MRRFLTFLTMLTVFVSAFSATALAIQPVASVFDDVTVAHKNADAIQYLKDEGLVEGYQDGTFRPDRQISRAEFLRILLTRDQNIGGENCYPDVTNQWHAKFVCRAKILEYAGGYADGNFYPDDKISFSQASRIIVEATDLEEIKGEYDKWYDGYVLALESAAAIPNTISNFDQKITRAEMAEMIWRIEEGITELSSNTYEDIAQYKAFGDGMKLETFESCGGLTNYLEDNRLGDHGQGLVYAEDAAVPLAESKAADDFSQTNVQVAGVDESDFVKNDGQYIYQVSSDGGAVDIVKAYPVEEMAVIDSLMFGDDFFSPQSLYLDGDTLVVMGQSYKNIYYMEPGKDVSMSLLVDDYNYNYSDTTRVFIYDVSNPAAPRLERHLSFEGDLTDSRKVDDRLYLVINKSNYMPRYYEANEWFSHESARPLYVDSAKSGLAEPIVPCNEILYHPGGENTDYLTLVGFDLSDNGSELSKEVVLGSSGEVYSSRENLYLSEYQNYWWWNDQGLDETTTIHKFNLGEDLSYQGKIDVPGTVLNQFSMDEHEGYFRVATTLGNLWGEVNPATNNVYIFNEDLERVGALEGLAPTERIYAVRFMGDRGYMVTFKKVDPLFVLDLEKPDSPKVLGELKIPGFSDYLHPLDQDHIIGFGIDTVEASEFDKEERNLDFAWFQGVKVALFDVSDVENPIEEDKVIIGDRGSSTPLSYDHKALWFDAGRGMFAFPISVSEISEGLKNDPNTSVNTYGVPVYQGAYVYDVDREGLELRGTITNNQGSDLNYGDSIKRVVRIGDYLYTIAGHSIKASNIDDLIEVKRVEF